MRYLVIFFLFFASLSSAQVDYNRCPYPQIIDFEFNSDTIVLTKIYYTREWKTFMGSHYPECVKHVEKQVYSAKFVKTIKGRVIGQKTVPEHFIFEEDFILSRSDTSTIFDFRHSINGLKFLKIEPDTIKTKTQ